MKIQQETREYKPITIKLEQKWEAEAMLKMVDLICRCKASKDRDIYPNDIGSDSAKLAIKISDAFTNCDVSI